MADTLSPDTYLSAGAIVLLLIVATILVRRYGWRSSNFISHVKLENKGCHCNEEVNHTLIKVEDSSTWTSCRTRENFLEHSTDLQYRMKWRWSELVMKIGLGENESKDDDKKHCELTEMLWTRWTDPNLFIRVDWDNWTLNDWWFMQSDLFRLIHNLFLYVLFCTIFLLHMINLAAYFHRTRFLLF